MIDRGNQKGITLVELIIATAITSLIVSGLGTAIYMMITVTERGNNEMSALHDIRNAAYYVNTDAQMASITDLEEGAEPVDNLSLEWTDGYGNSHSSSYWLSGTELQREYDSATSTVARYVSSVEFSISGSVLTFRVVSALSGRGQVSRETTSVVNLRPDM